MRDDRALLRRGQCRGRSVHPENPPRRGHGPAGDELEKRAAAGGLRWFLDRVSPPRHRDILGGQEPPQLPGRDGTAESRQAGRAISEHPGAVPDLPLGAFPANRGPRRRICLSRDAAVHESAGQADAGSGPGSQHRNLFGNRPRQAQYRLHPGLYFLTGLRRQVRRRGWIQDVDPGQGRRRSRFRVDEPQSHGRLRMDGLRGARPHHRLARPGREGRGRGPGRRL
jgi:hypothetical protein